jgi:hypothetical protein
MVVGVFFLSKRYLFNLIYMPILKETTRAKVQRLYRLGWAIIDIARECNTTQKWVEIWTKDLQTPITSNDKQ